GGLLGAAIYNEVTCSTAFFLHQLPTSIKSISSRHRCLHHIVALITRRLHIFQWQHRTAPARLLFIIDPKPSLQICHHMGSMLRCRWPLTFMTHCATNLIKRVWLDIRMDFIRLWDIRHFGILDPEMARHAAISNPELLVPNLLHLKWLGQELLLDIRVTLLGRPEAAILTLVLLPLWSVFFKRRPHE